MTILYIGNTTKQIRIFCYWPVEGTKLIAQEIKEGKQIVIAPHGSNTDLSSPEIEAIINQHKMYGLIAADELDTYRGPYGGLIYSLGKEISVDTLQRGLNKYEKQQEALGKLMRQEAAVFANNTIEEHGALNGYTIRDLEMSFTQEAPRIPSSDGQEPELISEGVRVLDEERRRRQ
jgi:hypothetical protein